MTREQLRETIRASRHEQGFGPTVTDGQFLGQLAAEVIDQDAPTVEIPAVVIPLHQAGGDGRGNAA